jgi:hypothetical protein
MVSNSFKQFIWLGLAIHVVWLVVTIIFGHVEIGDSQIYLLQAKNIYEYGSLYCYSLDETIDPLYYTCCPPIYGAFVGFLQQIIPSYFLVLVIQNLLSLLCWAWMYRICSGFNLTFNPAYILLPALLLFPNFFMVLNVIAADTLFYILLTSVLYSVYLFFNLRSLKLLTLAHIALLLALFTKPVLLFFSIPLFFFDWYVYLRVLRKGQVLALSLLLPLAIILWCGYNYTVTGKFHFSSVVYINLLEYNANYTLKVVHGEAAGDSITGGLDKIARNKSTYAERVGFIESESFKIMKQYPLEYLYCHIRGTLFFLFLEPGISEARAFFKLKEESESSRLAVERRGAIGFWQYTQNLSSFWQLYLWQAVLWWIVILLLSLAGFWLYRSNPFIVFSALLYFYLVAITGVVGCVRYKPAVYPIVLITAYLAIAFFVQKSFTKHRSAGH